MNRLPRFSAIAFVALLGCSTKSATPDTVAAALPAPSAAAVAPPEPQSAGIRVEEMAANEIPAGITYPGALLEARRWTDANGKNTLVVSREGPFKDGAEDGERGVKMHAFLYVERGGKQEQIWTLFDEERKCPFDLYIGLLPGSTTVTDLDADGQSEITLIYRKTCRSDVSPSTMKVILREGKDKYALRGVMCSTEEKSPEAPFCKYESESDFPSAPPAFLSHAKSQWRTFVTRDSFDQL